MTDTGDTGGVKTTVKDETCLRVMTQYTVILNYKNHMLNIDIWNDADHFTIKREVYVLIYNKKEKK